MEDRVLIKDLPAHMGKRVYIAGWIHSTRKQGSLAFILIRDRTGIAQVVASGKDVAENDIRNESVVIVTGKVIEDKRAKSELELKLEKIEVLSRPQKKLPILVNEKAEYQPRC